MARGDIVMRTYLASVASVADYENLCNPVFSRISWFHESESLHCQTSFKYGTPYGISLGYIEFVIRCTIPVGLGPPATKTDRIRC